MGPAPDPSVLTAFGLDGVVAHVPGGRGVTWRRGDIVLKPIDGRSGHDWICGVYDAWPASADVRVPKPLRTVGGAWSVTGWGAHQWVEGEHLHPGDDPGLFRSTTEEFHALTADLARPAFLDAREDPWSVGDRVAWEGHPPAGSGPVRALLDNVLAMLTPSPLAAQLVHGDLAGNLLWSDAGPAIIDWPPYFRPTGWALAVAAADAVAWQGAPSALLDGWRDEPDWSDLLLRAIAFRLATRTLRPPGAPLPEARIVRTISRWGT